MELRGPFTYYDAGAWNGTRLVCDTKFRTKAQQMQDLIKGMFDTSPYVLVSDL